MPTGHRTRETAPRTNSKSKKESLSTDLKPKRKPKKEVIIKGNGRCKRTSKTIKINMKRSLTDPAVRRLSKIKGGMRIGGNIYDLCKSESRSFLFSVLSQAMVYTRSANRTMISPKDVRKSLKNKNITLLGF